jgi:hypothetical protein
VRFEGGPVTGRLFIYKDELRIGVTKSLLPNLQRHMPPMR